MLIEIAKALSFLLKESEDSISKKIEDLELRNYDLGRWDTIVKSQCERKIQYNQGKIQQIRDIICQLEIEINKARKIDNPNDGRKNYENI